jgi:lipoic acid synthetase
VITSVDRDDLPDGGSAHYARCIGEIRARSPRTVVETLDPRLPGLRSRDADERAPDVLAHNVEVVAGCSARSATRAARSSARSRRCAARRASTRTCFTKSSIMLGLGETHDEIVESMQLPARRGVEFLTLGQYLRPTKKHAPVREYVTPERFDDYDRLGRAMGFHTSLAARSCAPATRPASSSRRGSCANDANSANG